MPPISNPMIISGGFPIEDDIPTSWMEDTIMLTEPIINVTPPMHLETTMSDCLIEEEIPPKWLEDSIKGTALNVNASFIVATGIDLDYCLAKGETHMGLFEGAPAYPTSTTHDPRFEPEMCSPRRFSEEHLLLISYMHREMADQLQFQSTLSCHLDLFFNSLSNEPGQSHYPTCCQLFIFTLLHDGFPGSPNVYLSYCHVFGSR
jgi:hypothetical protein